MSSPVFLRSRYLRSASCGLFLLFVASAAAADPAPSYPWQDGIWRRAAELQIDEALSRLPDRRKTGSDAERRAIDYTRAVLLLNVQPKLQGNIDEARTLLESLRQPEVNDPTALNALYYLARIAQFHADPAEPAKAVALYSELIARSPDHPLAQEALARLAALQLFENVPPEELRARVARYEAAGAKLSAPAARRDLHFVMATALLNVSDDPAGALRHLLAAEDAGIVRTQLAGDTMVRVAVLARRLGARDVAIAHYKKFLAAFARDNRAWMLGEQLRELEAEVPPPSTPMPAPPVPAATPAEPSAPVSAPPMGSTGPEAPLAVPAPSSP